MSSLSKVICVALLTFAFSININAAYTEEILGDNFDTFENMLKSSDAIIIGSSLNSYVKQVPYGTKEKIFRCSEIAVERIIHTNADLPSTITIETFEGDYYDNKVQGLSFRPPVFDPGKKFIALLKKEGQSYRLIYDSSGKIDIDNETVVYCKEPLETYLNKVERFVTGEVATFEGQQYDLYTAYNVHEDHDDHMEIAEKPAVLMTNGIYCVADSAYFKRFITRGQINMEFRINPTGARDTNGNAIPFNTLRTLTINACNAWSTIDDTNITFTVHADSFPSTWQSSGDGISTITFEAGPAWADYLGYSSTEGDVRFNPSLFWVLPGQSDPYDPLFYRSLVHELGHAVGLGDMGANCIAGCHAGDLANPINGRYNLMWHTGATAIMSIESPQWGDKAGAVYHSPNPSGTMVFNEVWSGYAEAGQPLTINSDVTVPYGKILEIASGSEIRFAAGVRLNVYGTLLIDPYLYPGTTLTSTGAGTYWSGIDIKSTGVMIVNGSVSIENADCGIDIANSAAFPAGNRKITIENCRQAGIWVDSCSPTIRRVLCDNVSTVNFQNGGINISGSSANPSIRRVTIQETYLGMKIANTSGTATVDSCNIKNTNINASIILFQNCGIDLNGVNNISPAANMFAISSYQNSRYPVDAQNNWWGTANPVWSSILVFPDSINHSNHNNVAAYTATVAGAYKNTGDF